MPSFTEINQQPYQVAGDYAIKEAKTLLPIAKSVTLLTNEEELVENRDEGLEDISIETRGVSEIVGENKVEAVTLKEGAKLDVEGVFVAVGTASSTDFARKLGAFINNNAIKVDKDMANNVEALYACGDCTGVLLQI